MRCARARIIHPVVEERRFPGSYRGLFIKLAIWAVASVGLMVLSVRTSDDVVCFASLANIWMFLALWIQHSGSAWRGLLYFGSFLLSVGGALMPVFGVCVAISVRGRG